MKWLALILLFFIAAPSFAVGDSDASEYYIDYYKSRCEPVEAYYYRIVSKVGEWWQVKDFYVAERTLASKGIYTDTFFSTPQGMLYEYHTNGKLRKKARYIDGEMVGMVKEYDTAGRLIDSGLYKHGIPYAAHYKWNSEGKVIFKGIYDSKGEGKGYEWHYFDDGTLADFGKTTYATAKDSTWTYYDRNGQLCCREYYKDRWLEKRECYKDGVLQEGTCEKTLIGFPGGWEEFHKIVNKYCNFPDNIGLRNGNHVYVLVRFAIDIDGSVTDVELVKKFHPEFDREVLYAISKVPKFIPMYDHNRPEKQYMDMPFRFTLIGN